MHAVFSFQSPALNAQVSKRVNASEKRRSAQQWEHAPNETRSNRGSADRDRQSLRIHDVAKRDSGAMQDEQPTNEPRSNRVLIAFCGFEKFRT